MKILNTINELWDYCLFCPICQENCRTIQLAVGPEDYFYLSSFKKDNDIIYLNIDSISSDKKYKFNYVINCLSNKFEFTPLDGKAHAIFYFYINGICKKCNMSYANSADLEFSFSNQKISYIGIEREGIYLLKQYHVTLLYDLDEMILSRCQIDDNGILIDQNKPFRTKLLDLNLSDPIKAINKIKMLLVFS